MHNLFEKAASRIELNSDLLQVAIGAFFVIITMRAELLNSMPLLVQLVASIPLLLTSPLADSKVRYKKDTDIWNRLGWVTFIIAYAFLLNTIGILIGIWISVGVSLIFFALSALLTVIHSVIEVKYDKKSIKERLIKDSLFISVHIVFGVLVVLKVF
jgi:hypothetical protein